MDQLPTDFVNATLVETTASQTNENSWMHSNLQAALSLSETIYVDRLESVFLAYLCPICRPKYSPLNAEPFSDLTRVEDGRGVVVGGKLLGGWDPPTDALVGGQNTFFVTGAHISLWSPLVRWESSNKHRPSERNKRTEGVSIYCLFTSMASFRSILHSTPYSHSARQIHQIRFFAFRLHWNIAERDSLGLVLAENVGENAQSKRRKNSNAEEWFTANFLQTLSTPWSSFSHYFETFWKGGELLFKPWTNIDFICAS